MSGRCLASECRIWIRFQFDDNIYKYIDTVKYFYIMLKSNGSFNGIAMVN